MQTMSNAEKSALTVTIESVALYLKGFQYRKLTHVSMFMSGHGGTSVFGVTIYILGTKSSTKQLTVLGAAAGALGGLGTSNGTT